MTGRDRLVPYVVALDGEIRTGDATRIREAATGLVGAASVLLDLCVACGATVDRGATECSEHKGANHGS